jgi:hypothetical protein
VFVEGGGGVSIHLEVVEAKGFLLAEPAVALLEGSVPFARRVALVDNRGGDVLALLEEVLNAPGIETGGIDACSPAATSEP